MTIRRLPEDFRVDEELDPAYRESLAAAASADAPVAVCRLSKTGWTTPDAAGALARALQVPAGRVSWAGLKDRHAETTQHVTVERPPPAAVRALAQGIEGSGWRARTVGWAAEPIDASAIASNSFEIVVRGLAAADVARMHERAAALRAPDGSLAVVNYFGDQRFGSARHGKGFAARALLAGDPVGALRLLVGTPARKDQGMQRAFTRLCAAHWGDWHRLARELPSCADRAPFERLAAGAEPFEAFAALRPFLRTMCIEAYQSLLWNDGARRMARSLPGSAIEAPDDFGPLVFPCAAALPAEWGACCPPMPSPAMEFREPWGAAWQASLAAEGLAAEALAVPGGAGIRFGEATRPLVAGAAGFALDEPTEDRTRRGALAVTVRFALPRGAYATVLLRALGQ